MLGFMSFMGAYYLTDLARHKNMRTEVERKPRLARGEEETSEEDGARRELG